MKAVLFLLVAGASGGFTASSASAAESGAVPIAPFHVEYATSRNGKMLGHTTLELSRNTDGTWKFRSETDGTEGLASLLGVHITETSLFHWNSGEPVGISYEYRQDGIKSRRRDIAFDANAGQIRVDNGKKTHEYALQPGSIDRNLVSLAIAAGLANGKQDMAFPVATKSAVQTQHYKVDGHERSKVPAGSWDSVRVVRTDANKDMTIWFAKAIGWLPVRIKQSGDNTITLELVSLTPAK